MKKAETCKSDCSKEFIKQWYSEGKEIPAELLLSCESCFEEYVACEAAVVSLFPESLIISSSSELSHIYEEIDLAKAERSIGGSAGHDLPDFLKHYTTENLTQPEKKNQLMVRLSAKGFHIIDGILDSVRLVESLNLIPVLRSSVDTLSTDHSSVIFEETVAGGQVFYYQLIKENPEDVYLSVKAESIGEGSFKQVNLRRDGRFILSSLVSPDGVASFSGLKAGNYSIEFQGDTQSKSFDLSILVG